MTDVNIDKLSSEELEALSKKIQAKQKLIKDEERASFIAEIAPRAKAYGLKLVDANSNKDVSSTKTGKDSSEGTKRKIKTYLNPTTGEAWIRAGAAARQANIPSWVKKPDGTINEDYLKKE
jgi:hypothetical protein